MLNFLLETIRLGLKNLWLHKLRSTLTALGIIFGVLAFVIMVAIGEGAKRTALEQLRQLGARNILVRSVPPPASNDASQRNQRILDYGIRRTDLSRLEIMPGLAAIVPLRDTEQKVVRGDMRVSANAIGTTPQVFDVINLPLDRGRYFSNVDYESSAPVCVLGSLAAQQLFPYQDPLGEQIQVGSVETGVVILTVIGVLEKTGLRPGGTIIKREIDQDIYFPLTLAQTVFRDVVIKRMSGTFERKSIEISEVWLQTQSMDDVERLAAVAENIVKTGHASIDFEVKAPIEILRNAERQQRMFNFVLGGISLLSLLVGGIGIMNIMLASVTERTREIGIRRALGAKQRHIIQQFLVETTVISVSGGLIGIAVSCAVAILLPMLLRAAGMEPYRTDIAAWSVVCSFMFSGLVGIGFGLYPAITAAKLNPIEALRHE